MENKKGIELIKLEVLGCINEKDNNNLMNMKETDESFPWKVLADYQNLVSLLPLALTMDYPDSELKDKTATKLYNIRDEIKAKLEAKKEKEHPVVNQDSPKEVEVLEEVQIHDDDIPADEVDTVQVKTNVQEETVLDSVKFTVDSKDSTTTKALPNKEDIEKTVKDYIKLHFESEFETLTSGVKKNRILSLILFLITLALIVALYFVK